METETLLTTNTAPASRPGADGYPTAEWRAWATRVLSGDRRPEDYLPVPDEVREIGGVEASKNRMSAQLRSCVLSFHYPGQNIGVIEDDRGLIVVAVGLDQIEALCHTMPYELTQSVAFDAPDVPGTAEILHLDVCRTGNPA